MGVGHVVPFFFPVWYVSAIRSQKRKTALSFLPSLLENSLFFPSHKLCFLLTLDFAMLARFPLFPPPSLINLLTDLGESDSFKAVLGNTGDSLSTKDIAPLF